jgi:hypothetical protein
MEKKQDTLVHRVSIYIQCRHPCRRRCCRLRCRRHRRRRRRRCSRQRRRFHCHRRDCRCHRRCCCCRRRCRCRCRRRHRGCCCCRRCLAIVVVVVKVVIIATSLSSQGRLSCSPSQHLQPQIFPLIFLYGGGCSVDDDDDHDIRLCRNGRVVIIHIILLAVFVFLGGQSEELDRTKAQRRCP